MASFDYESLIVDIPDYPEPGVIFKDIMPLLGDSQGFANVIDDLVDHYVGLGVTKVVSAEARGFLLGSAVAYRLSAGFVAARKPGKLPREVYSQAYALEYGEDELQIHVDALTADDKVIIVDDLMATGGTAIACAQLAEKAGAEVLGFGCILELDFLHPRETLAKAGFDRDFYSLVKVN